MSSILSLQQSICHRHNSTKHLERISIYCSVELCTEINESLIVTSKELLRNIEDAVRSSNYRIQCRASLDILTLSSERSSSLDGSLHILRVAGKQDASIFLCTLQRRIPSSLQVSISSRTIVHQLEVSYLIPTVHVTSAN